jgi:uncharacterized membrane protein YeiH
MNMSMFFLICEWLGTAAFAVSGAMVAVDKGMDLFGVIFLAMITALGGGTLRDVLIGHFPPRMFTNYQYLTLAVVCALAVFLLADVFKERYIRSEQGIERVNNVFDAIGLGVFAVSGARIGMEAGFMDNAFLVTFLGMTTAVGGGMIRDVLLQEIPFVLNKRVYAVAAIAGALTYWVMEVVFLNSVLAYALGWLVTVTLRMLATIYKWNLPKAI